MPKTIIDIQKLEKAAYKLRTITHPMRIKIITMLDNNTEMNVTDIYNKGYKAFEGFVKFQTLIHIDLKAEDVNSTNFKEILKDRIAHGSFPSTLKIFIYILVCVCHTKINTVL